jgi:hypothetical protein
MVEGDGPVQTCPTFKSKRICQQGFFKWSISFGVELLAPPLAESSNGMKLSEGDIFIRVCEGIEDSTKKAQVWCLSSTPSMSRLVWKTWEPFKGIRLIDGIPYVLILQNNHEPSWILERSLARRRRKVCIVQCFDYNFGHHLS